MMKYFHDQDQTTALKKQAATLMRSHGWTFASIAKRLDIGTTTAFRWTKDVQFCNETNPATRTALIPHPIHKKAQKVITVTVTPCDRHKTGGTKRLPHFVHDPHTSELGILLKTIDRLQTPPRW